MSVSKRAKQIITDDPEFAGDVRILDDYIQHVENSIIDLCGKRVSAGVLAKIVRCLILSCGKQWPDVYEIMRTMQAAGLGSISDFMEQLEEHA